MTPPPRIVTLVVDEPRGVLPPIEVTTPWWMESGPIVEAALVAFGVEISVVRLLHGGTFPGGPVTYLVEAPDISPDRINPWVGELGDDERRAHYARPGGIAALTGWADQALAHHGLGRKGPVDQVRTWNLSCLLRMRADDQTTVWLKAVPSFFAHEAEVIDALSRVDPTLVPELLATVPGASLMRQAGVSDGYDVVPDRHFAAVTRFEAARRRLDLDQLATTPRFGSADMAMALEDLAARHGDELGNDERENLTRLITEVEDRWNAAATVETLVHGDLHGGNLRLASDGGDDVIIDWGDASVSHPLFDLAVLDSYTPEWGQEATDRWLNLLGLDRSAWEAFRPLAAIRLAIVYRGFCDRIEATEQIYHRDDIAPAIRAGLSFLDE